jgi:hypothetical protein
MRNFGFLFVDEYQFSAKQEKNDAKSNGRCRKVSHFDC